jgi:hypothetical protein
MYLTQGKPWTGRQLEPACYKDRFADQEINVLASLVELRPGAPGPSSGKDFESLWGQFTLTNSNDSSSPMSQRSCENVLVVSGLREPLATPKRREEMNMSRNTVYLGLTGAICGQ